MEVVMGGLTLNTTEETEQTIRVEQAIVHENYKETPTAVYNDIGDLHLCFFNIKEIMISPTVSKFNV